MLVTVRTQNPSAQTWFEKVRCKKKLGGNCRPSAFIKQRKWKEKTNKNMQKKTEYIMYKSDVIIIKCVSTFNNSFFFVLILFLFLFLFFCFFLFVFVFSDLFFFLSFFLPRLFFFFSSICPWQTISVLFYLKWNFKFQNTHKQSFPR